MGFLGMFSGRLTKALGECKTAILLMGCGALACVMLALTSSPAVSIFGAGFCLAACAAYIVQACGEKNS